MKYARYALGLMTAASVFAACDHRLDPFPRENTGTFREVASIDFGGTAASEISAYDSLSKRIFTVNNEAAPKVEVVEVSATLTLNRLAPIDISALGGVANSVAVSNGLLAIALEAVNKQANGSVVIVDTRTLRVLRTVAVGPMPDMVTFSPDGRYIVTADEGEPNAAYTVDPVGSVSIIDVRSNYSVKTLTFEGFEAQRATLTAGGFRVYGPRASFAQDIEPEYVAISPDSRRAWVTLQENNAIAEVDLVVGSILKIWPLGTKDVTMPANAIDPSDRDSRVQLGTWPVQAFFLPDAIAPFAASGIDYVVTADEGDTRAYTGYNEEARIGALTLDPAAFPNAATLRQDANLGRLIATRSAGDIDGDGDFDRLNVIGGRGFSVYNTTTGQRVWTAGRTLEDRVIAFGGRYDDNRSDDKGVEPEGVTIGMLNGQPIAFVGLERADAVAIYNMSDPMNPQFVQLLPTGDAPEGILFVPANQSPNRRSLLIVSSEGDGTVKLYQPDQL
jgi:DNA-binding beta-propeller fold protein YncE